MFVKLWAGQSLKLTVNGMSLEPGTVLVQNHNGSTDAEGKELTEQDLQAITSGNFSAQVHQSQALSQTLTASEVSFGLADKLGDQRMAGSNGVMDLIVIDEIGTINASNTSPFGEVFSQQSLSRLTAIIASDDLLNDTISQYDRRSNNWFAAARYESILTTSASRSVRSVTGEGTAASIPFVEMTSRANRPRAKSGRPARTRPGTAKRTSRGIRGRATAWPGPWTCAIRSDRGRAGLPGPLAVSIPKQRSAAFGLRLALVIRLAPTSTGRAN